MTIFMAHQYKRKQQATKVKQTNHKTNKFNKTKPQIKNRKYTTLLIHQSKSTIPKSNVQNTANQPMHKNKNQNNKSNGSYTKSKQSNKQQNKI